MALIRRTTHPSCDKHGRPRTDSVTPKDPAIHGPTPSTQSEYLNAESTYMVDFDHWFQNPSAPQEATNTIIPAYNNSEDLLTAVQATLDILSDRVGGLSPPYSSNAVLQTNTQFSNYSQIENAPPSAGVYLKPPELPWRGAMGSTGSQRDAFSSATQATRPGIHYPGASKLPQLELPGQKMNVTPSQALHDPQGSRGVVYGAYESPSIGASTASPTAVSPTAKKHGSLTENNHIGFGCSSMSVMPDETPSPSFRSRPSSCAQSKQKAQAPKRPYEFAWEVASGNPAPWEPKKRRRTKKERQATNRIRALGGACENCKKQHRRCDVEHHPLSASSSPKKPVEVASEGSPAAMSPENGDHGPNPPGKDSDDQTPGTESSVNASSPTMQQPTEAVLRLDVPHNFGNAAAEVGRQFRNARDMAPQDSTSAESSSYISPHVSSTPPEQSLPLAVDDSYFDASPASFNESQIFLDETDDANLQLYLSWLGDVFNPSSPNSSNTY
ncbi:hypothetical protein FQN53_002912 [Emmonsiellopsis sp. PD_33]|nr:hypothetical protein FQN53_002912 [Emmonsiellopsis sp. PD_33]